MNDIVSTRRYFVPLSAVLVVLSAIMLFVPGLNLGIDFVAGTSTTYEFSDDDPGTDAVRDAFVAAGRAEAIVQNLGDAQYFVRTGELTLDEQNDLATRLSEQTGQEPTVLETITVGSSVAQGTVRNAIIAVVVAAAFVMLYIMYAFRSIESSYRYAIAAVVALIHDVMIVLGVFALLGIVINAEVNAIFIVGILTVIGYSVNDTIVIFDRIRENVILVPSREFRTTVNASIRESVIRSLGTSITTGTVILAMLLFGGESLRDFLIVLLLGVIVGTYSSVFIASQTLVAWSDGEFGRWLRRIPIPRRRRATA